MSGETDLDVLLGSMTASLVEGVFVFATLENRSVPDGLVARMVFQEAEGTTLILLQSEADKFGLGYEFPCRMITLNIHSALEAVGFIARIATELAKEGMGVNPVAGFYHDHLYVPVGREEDALKVIAKLAASSV